MERSRKILRKIASASHRVVSAANKYADYKDLLNVERAHFQLEENMQSVSAACEWLMTIFPVAPPLPRGSSFERLKDWLTGGEPRVCYETLNQMEMLLREDGGAIQIPTGMGVRGMTATKDKIGEAINLFDSRKRSFHLLFATDIWGVQQQRDVFHDIHDPSTSHTTPFIPPTPSMHDIPVTQPRSDAPDPHCPAPFASLTSHNTTPFVGPSVYGTPVTQPRSDPPNSHYSAPSALPVSPEVPHAVPFGGPPGPAIQGSADFTGYPPSFQHTPWAIPPTRSPPRPVQYPATVYNTFNRGVMRPPAALPPGCHHIRRMADIRLGNTRLNSQPPSKVPDTQHPRTPAPDARPHPLPYVPMDDLRAEPQEWV
ncbi:hypothetical protein HD554DRAFT_2313218 [Boletus coccyginus]|nr:hypothetical protein HD554DRAFT_2313218 [Boletus coccyginus]